MSRTQYEDKSDLKRERAVVDYISQHCSHDWHYKKLETPDGSEIDFGAFREKGHRDNLVGLQRLIEVKTYPSWRVDQLRSDDFYDFYTACHKVDNLIEQSKKAPARLVAAFSCGSIGYLDEESMGEYKDVGYDGHSNPRDKWDKELVYYYNFDQFTWIKKEVPMPWD